jgi:hypothetical protein
MKIPTYLPSIKEPRKGYKWVYRGQGWENNSTKANYATHSDTYGWSYYDNNHPLGLSHKHYVELVKDHSSLEEQIVLAKAMVGKTYKWRNDEPMVIESWHVTNSASHCDHGAMVVQEVISNDVCVYVVANYAQYPVTNQDLVEIIKPEFYELKLNKDYTAKVYEGKFTVGCQTFPISVLGELLNLHKKHKE